MSVPSISVAIPTLGRSPMLDRVLQRLQQDAAISDVLVIVNGGEEHRVPQWLNRERVHTFTLPRASLQAARNLALSEASGDYLAYLDDDAVPEPGWFQGLVGFLGRHPRISAVGGPAKLPKGWTFPPWMTDAALGYLGIVDLGEHEMVCPPWQYPFGCNFAIHRNFVRGLGGFDQRFGYVGRSLIPNEETTLFRTIQKNGGEVWYTPAMAVRHHVSKGRFRMTYLIRRAYAQGRGDTRMARLHPDYPVRRGMLEMARVARWTAAATYRWIAGQRREACDHVLRAARQIGMVRG